MSSKMDNDTKQEVDLLYGENIFTFKAKNNVDTFSMAHVFLLDEDGQFPLFFEIKKDTSSKLINYEIIDDKNHPNKLIKFTFAPMKKNEEITLHFEYWVIVKNRDYQDLPKYVEMPKDSDLSDYAKKWIYPTKAVQSNNIFIKIKSSSLKLFTKNLFVFSKRISYSICFHRLILLHLILYLGNVLLTKKYWPYLMDAVSCYFLGGTCAAKTNLEVGLFRSKGIPARGLIGTTMYYEGKKWCDAQHFFFEYYCPKYGWIRGMSGRVPYESKNCIVLRINYPEDENIAGGAFDYYGGCEPWFWIDNKDIVLGFPEGAKYYKKRKGYGRPINRGWIEAECMINRIDAKQVTDIVRAVWELYVKYLGMSFNDSNGHYFSSGVDLQKRAIESLRKSDVNEFIRNMDLVYKEYKKITLLEVR